MKTDLPNPDHSPEEPALGWREMPAYGEVMPALVGVAHMGRPVDMKWRKSTVQALMRSFWRSVLDAK